jgi:hypothetical protein
MFSNKTFLLLRYMMNTAGGYKNTAKISVFLYLSQLRLNNIPVTCLFLQAVVKLELHLF